jgi:hypothetical protein
MYKGCLDVAGIDASARQPWLSRQPVDMKSSLFRSFEVHFPMTRARSRGFAKREEKVHGTKLVDAAIDYSQLKPILKSTVTTRVEWVKET